MTPQYPCSVQMKRPFEILRPSDAYIRTMNWVNIGSTNGLLLVGGQGLYPLLTYKASYNAVLTTIIIVIYQFIIHWDLFENEAFKIEDTFPRGYVLMFLTERSSR